MSITTRAVKEAFQVVTRQVALVILMSRIGLFDIIVTVRIAADMKIAFSLIWIFDVQVKS